MSSWPGTGGWARCCSLHCGSSQRRASGVPCASLGIINKGSRCNNWTTRHLQPRRRLRNSPGQTCRVWGSSVTMVLNLEEPQVLVEYPNDGVPWRHRVLPRRLREAVWIVVTTERHVQIEGLSSFNLLPLSRGGPFRDRPPSHTSSPTHSTTSWKDHTPRLHGWQRSWVLLPESRAAPAARWRSRHFSCRVWAGGRNRSGLEPSHWCRALIGLVRSGEPLPNVDLAWEADKHAGAGRDRRLGAPTSINAGSVMSLGDALALASFCPRELKDMIGWPHEGPRATLEVLQSIHRLGVAPTSYHDLWQQRSGVHSEAAVCLEHKLLRGSPYCTIVSM